MILYGPRTEGGILCCTPPLGQRCPQGTLTELIAPSALVNLTEAKWAGRTGTIIHALTDATDYNKTGKSRFFDEQSWLAVEATLGA